MNRFFAAVACCLVIAVSSYANLVPVGPVPFSGTGLGSVNTILTIEDEPTESGCVSYNGTADVVGPTACPPGIAGGDEKTGQSQTQTRTIQELGLTTAAQLRIVVNLNENELNPVILRNLVLRIFSPTGVEVFNSGTAFVPVLDLFGQSGTGQAGYVFQLDATQAAQAQAAFAPTNRVGIAATLEGTTSGFETFFIADVAQIGQPLGVADLAIAKVAPATTFAGTQLTYTLTVNNIGTEPATNVTVTDVLPPELRFVSVTPAAGFTCTTPLIGNPGTVRCTAATLAVGASANIAITARSCGEVGCNTALTNRATVSGATFDPVVANNAANAVTTTQARSDLGITKTASVTAVPPGGTLSYTVTVSNAGPSSSVNTVVVDTLPAGFTATSVSTNAGTCTGVGTGTVTCNLGTLGSANTCTTGAPAPTTAVVTIVAQAGTTAGDAVNTATVTSGNCVADANTANNTARRTVAVTVAAAGIPTLSEWALIAMAMMLLLAGVFATRN